MVRNARRNRVLFFVAIALAGLMAAPFDACDDYAFLNLWASPAHAGLPGLASEDTVEPSEEQTDHSHVCTCIVCNLTTDDSFAPVLPPPQRRETVPPARPVAFSSPYIQDVYHPPIA
jgi:hypothetical protein